MTKPLPGSALTRKLAASATAVVLMVAMVTAGPPAATAQPVSAAAAAVSADAAARYPHYGDQSSAVWSLQKKLVKAGLLRADRRTGHFGKYTKSAIKRLQKRYDLAATGRVGAKTMAALEKAVKAMTGPKTWYHKETIGTSADGRPIVAYRAGEQGKPVVMVVATMHGEEDFGQYLVHGLMEGAAIKDVDLWLVPVLNPDGLAKNRRWVAHGVDLNRNFPNRFIRRANSGPKAKSAKETRVIVSFLNRIRPKYLVSWHQPLHGVDT
jgi:Zinc carboxypeptidase/Putative peptidoglycan binding domain